MRGAVIFDTLIEYLTKATHFGNAEQIVLAGSSGDLFVFVLVIFLNVLFLFKYSQTYKPT